MNKISGIYQIQSKIKPERIYIGSAVDVSKRRIGHFYTLRCNKHRSKKLQHHFNKYGKNDLQFSLLFECDKEVLIHAEQAFLDYYKPYFNVCKIAGSCLGLKRSEKINKKYIGNKYALGHKLSDEYKNKLSEKQSQKIGIKNSFYGKKHTKEAIQKMCEACKKRTYFYNSRITLQYDLQDNFIKEWKSVNEAARCLNIYSSLISACCRNECGRKTAGGFIWKYKNIIQ
jgi:group I intron endonuclease